MIALAFDWLGSWWAPLVAGPFVGSFAGVVVERWSSGEPLVAGRSRCRGCGRRLAFYDMIPLVSWLALRGRCRSCDATIGLTAPLVEVGGLGVAAWAAFAAAPGMLWPTCLLGWWLMTLALLDLDALILPDRLTLPLLAAGLTVNAGLGPSAGWLAYPLGALLGYGVLVAVERSYRRLRGRDGLGRGDAKLLAAGGAWVGVAGLPSVVLAAALLGILAFGARALVEGGTDGTTPLPFGPALALGIWLVWLYGPLRL